MANSDTAGQDTTEWEALSAEEKDFELARRLQEQEAAMFHFYEQRNGSGEMGFQSYDRLDGSSDEEAVETSSGNEVMDDSQPEDHDTRAIEMQVESADREGNAAGSDSPAEEIDDAEFARRLHLQEQIDHHRRILEMAGIQPGEEDEYEVEEDDDEINEDDDEDDEEDDEAVDAYFTEDSIEPDDMTYEELMAIGETVGVVSKGLSAEAINHLPQAIYVHPSEKPSDVLPMKGALHRGNDTDEQCTVCRMEFETKNTVKILPCGHIFHPACVDQWLAINKVCPNCGKEVGRSDERKHEALTQSLSREYLPKLS